MSAPVTINLHRGLLSLGRQLAVRVSRHGAEVWDKGLGQIMAKQLEKSPIPAGEIPVEDFLDRVQHIPVKRRKR